MSKIVSRIANCDLLLAGEVDETTPTINDSGLQAFYPFDGKVDGKAPSRNLMDSSVWVPSTYGSQGVFTVNQNTAGENEITVYKNPWGQQDVVWATLWNDSTSDADGGWDTSAAFPVDPTKKYRFSVWIRREGSNGVGSGRTYFGCQGGNVYNIGTTTVNGNPYFVYPAYSDMPQMEGNWLLYVYYVYPNGYTTPLDTTAGIYDVQGNKISSVVQANYTWTPTTTASGLRTYLYYSTNQTEKCYWYRPRVELCDGYESTITDLINGNEDAKKVVSVTSPALVTYAGISCGQSGVTNYVNTTVGALGAQVATGPWGGMTITGSGYVNDATPFGDIPVGQVSFYDATSGGMQFQFAGTYGVSPSTTYTYSMYVKWSPNITPISTPNWLYVFEYNSSNTEVTEYGVATQNSFAKAEDVGMGWYRIWGTFTTSSTTSRVDLRSYTYEGNSSDPHWIKFFGAQLEQNPYMTPLIQGNGTASRAGNGSVYLPLNVGNGNFTVVGWMRRNRPHDNTIVSNDVDIGIRTTSGLWAYLRYYLNAGVVTPWIDADAWPNKTAQHLYANAGVFFPVNIWLPFRISRNGNTLRISLKNSNGVWYDWFEYPSVNEYFDQFYLNSATNSTYKDVAIYNRLLSDDEINRLTGSSNVLSPNGKLTGVVISEEQNVIPQYSLHFPLHKDGMDKYKVITPSTEQNTVYDGGCVWVGPAMTNQLSARQTGGFFSQSHDGTNYGWGSTTNINQVVASELQMFPNVDTTKAFRINSNVSQKFYLAPYTTAAASTTNAYSFYVYSTYGSNIAIYNNEGHCALTGDNNLVGRNGSTNVTYKIQPRKWTRVKLMAVTDASGTSVNSWVNLDDGATETLSMGEFMAFTGWQLESGTKCSPFTPSSRGAGKLYLPLVRAQNTNFSINIWVSTRGCGGANEVVDIFCDDTDRWNGQLRSQGTQIELLVRAASRGATSNLYANLPSTWDTRKWNMVTLVSANGYGCYVYANGVQIGAYPNVYPQYTSLSVGRNGQGDSLMNGAYFRDLTVTDFQFTVQQITDLYKKQIASTQHTSNIQGGINEVENLT